MTEEPNQTYCKHCLEPTNGSRWCSDECMIQEDGIPYEWLEEDA